MDVLLFGGSFDPPHLGHVQLLKEAIRYHRPGKVYVVPSFQTPLKGPASAPPGDRVRMLELALRELPSSFRRRIKIDLLEIQRGRRTYTVDVAREIRRRHPKDRLYLLVGSDALRTFRHWRNWPSLLKQARLLVGKRAGFLTGFDPSGLKIEWLPGLFPSISSTELRRRVAAGEDPADECPETVLRYADRRGLYDRRLHRWLKRHLSRERYDHTLAVTRLSQELAGAYRLDMDGARTAALLHDAGRSMPPAKLVRYVRRFRLRVPGAKEIERHQPVLFHPFVSAHLARSRFGIQDARILRAIESHTLGARRMGPLERILYVADIASEDRNFPEASAIRKLAFEDLEAALKEATRVKLSYVLASGQWLHPVGFLLWNELQTLGTDS